MKMNNWSYGVGYASAYTAPELLQPRLHGIIEGHPRLEDGSEATTSRIVGKSGELVVTESGGMYELGDVNPDYEQQYPNARERLLSSLPEVSKPDENEHRNRHAEYASRM